MKLRILTSLLAMSLIASLACTDPASSYCASAAECDEEGFFFGIPIDGVGDADDSEQVCRVDVRTALDGLRQNGEDDCHALADAYEAWFACIAEEDADCEAWYDDECEDEREDIDELRQDVGNRCNE